MPKLRTERQKDARITSYFSRTHATSPVPSLSAVNCSQTQSVLVDGDGENQVPEVPGLSIHNNFVTPEQESFILAFLETQDWRTDLQRRCMHYGGTYCLLHEPDVTIPAPPIPDELHFLLERFAERGIYGRGHYAPGYCIVNEYVGAQGISAHVENFRFGEPVCGVTLVGGGWIRFHELVVEDDGSVRSGGAAKAKRTGRKVDVWLERRSCVVMRGDARRKWQHEIVRSAKGRGDGWRRVSLTFRVEK